MVNLQILNGAEFTSFYGYQGMITDNITIPYSALNSVELKQDHFFSGSPTTVLVESNIGGLIKQESIIAYPKSSYGINAETVDYPIHYGDTKYIEVTTYGPGGCAAIFPSDIKLNAVITKGSESGYLQDFDHGTTGDTLINITFSDFGGNHIGFISDGVKKDIADTVIVTFSTTDAEIGSKQITVIINPSPLYLAIEPENVAPGDTALIIIKSRLEDGTLIDFPEWQTFEVKMIEGCALGKILAGEDTARYFYDVPQPIKFIADSLASGTVKLIVGLVEEIIGTRPVQENESDEIEKTSKDKLSKQKEDKTKKEINENPSYNPGEEFCPIEEIQSITTEEINFPVGDECDNYKCDENYLQYSPAIKLDIVPPDYAGFDYCNNLVVGAIGLTDLLFDWEDSDPEKKGKLLVPFKIEELCFDKLNNYWNYSIVSKNISEFINTYDRWDSFFIRVVSTVCIDAYANSGTDFTLIQNLEELDEKVSVENVCLALQDFEYNRPYASDPLFQEELHNYIQTRNNTSEFKFCEIVPADTMHEYVHYKNIEEEVISTLNIRVPELNNKKYSTILKHIELPCEQAKTPEEAELEIDKQYKKVWARFVEDLKKSDDKRTNDPRNENNTQWSRMVQNLITEYQDELKLISPGGGHCSIIELIRRDI